MSTSLANFQDRFAHALLAADGDIAPDIAALVRQPGFSVYRNTVMKGYIDSLQANFPSVARLVGEEWFRAAAAVYAEAHKPVDPRMLYYGDSFPDFLAQFEPAAQLPYLPDVARLDRCWTQAHGARDQSALDPACLTSFAPDALGNVVLHPHPATCWKWFDEQPVYTIWQRNREAVYDDSDIAWQGEGALIVRPRSVVQWMPLSAAGCAFLDACSAGRPLAEAAATALETDRKTDLAQLLARLLEAGAFGQISGADDSPVLKEST